MKNLNLLTDEVPVSVIVPVYNVYEYLDECLLSLTGQTFSDFELLLINDWSTDESGKKCEEWAQKDSRIRYISKANEGLAVTRNLGLKEAKGKYIVFVDSDDWVDPRFLELLYTGIKETGADIAECDFWRYDNNTGKKTYRACYGRMGIAYSLEEHMIYGQTMAWKYMTRKSLWTDNDIEMPDCMSASHGVYALLLALSNQVVNIREPLYYYRRFRKGSILDTNGKSGNQKGILGISALDYLVKGFKQCGLYEQYKDTLRRIVTYSLSDYLASQFVRRTREEFKQLAQTYYEYADSLFHGGGDQKYLTLGGYNLNRILFHVNRIHNPYCRFNFSSIISIMSPLGGAVPCKHTNQYRQIMIERDIAASFWDVMEETKPSHVFIDFLEERFDMMEYQGAYITKSDAFDGMDETLDAYRIIPRNSAECGRLWQEKCQAFIQKLLTFVPAENIVVVKNYLSELTGDCDTREPFSNLDEIREINGRLEGYYQFFADRCGEVKVIEVRELPMYFTDRKYEYGAVPSHLNEIVNEEIAKQIEETLI